MSPNTGPRIESILHARTHWEGDFLGFCNHVQQQLRIPYGRTMISRILEAYGVRIPKRRVGRSPDELALKGQLERFFPGAQWTGDGSPITVWVDVVAGEAVAAELVLIAAGGTGRGALGVRCDAPATVFVDEREVGTAPTAEIPVDAGERRVRVVDDSGRAWEELVAVAAGQTMVVEVRLGSGAAGLDPLWFWLTAGTAGALAVGGAATGGYVLSLKDEYDDPATSAARADEIRSTGDPLRVATDALFGAAGALAIAAITLVFFTDFSGEGGADADVGPLLQPETGVGERALFQW